MLPKPQPSLGDFFDSEVVPRLNAEQVFDHPAHKWQTKSATRWRGGCPNHDSQSGSSFTVNPQEMTWFCAGCHIGGGPTQYIHWVRGGDGRPSGEDFAEIVRELAGKAGVDVPAVTMTPEQQAEHRRIEARRAALEFLFRLCEEHLWTDAGVAARDYLHSRGINDDAIREFGLGLHPSGSATAQAMQIAGFDPSIVDNNFRGHIAIPWHDAAGRPLTLYGRTVGDPPPAVPKTRALPGEGSKGSPFLFHRARRNGTKEIVLVEGLTDALVAHVHGDTRVVACVAAQLSQLQVETLRRYRTESVVISLDPDSAGDRGIRSCIDQLDAVGITAYVAPRLPDGVDPDDFTLRNGIDAWRSHVDGAAHGYRWVARTIIADAGEINDRAIERIAKASAAFAAERPAERADMLRRQFWPELEPVIGPPIEVTPGGDHKGLPQARTFPLDSLPIPARTLVDEGAKASDIDPAFVALPLLAIAGGLIGPKVKLELKSGWTETAQLWMAAVAEPGRGKTPGERHARTVLERLQSEAFDQYESALADYRSELAAWQAALPDQRGTKPDAPKLKSYYSADATMEALAGMLSVRPGLVVLRDELVSWVRSCDAYRGGRGGDRSAWLSSWSGVAVKVDRKTDQPVYIKEPVVSVVGGIQPDMLPALAEEANRRDGFVERILYAFPDDHVPGWTDTEVKPETLTAVEKQLRTLAQLSTIEEPVRFSPEARSLWVAWYDDHTAAQAAVGGILGGLYAKLPIQFARLALLLHVLEATGNQTNQIPTRVSMGTLERARDLVEYFKAHAHRVVPAFGQAQSVIPGLTPERQHILGYHRQHGAASSKEVAEALEMNPDSVNELHRRMLDRGLVIKTKHGVYDLPKAPEDHFSSVWNVGNVWNGATTEPIPNEPNVPTGREMTTTGQQFCRVCRRVLGNPTDRERGAHAECAEQEAA